MIKHLLLFFIFLFALFTYKMSPTTPSLFASESILLPDISHGIKGRGFTCTGLAFDKNEDIFYVANYGKAHPTDSTQKPSIVKISKDFKKNLHEIPLYNISTPITGIQGLCIDRSNDTIWFCAFENNQIINISKQGEIKHIIPIDRPTGIAYDSRSDTCWVLTSSHLHHVSKDGHIISSLEIQEQGQDQLYLDEAKNIIYMTAGIDYQQAQFVYLIDLSSGRYEKILTLEDSYAIEGIYIENDRMHILNDGYFHDSKIPHNILNIYKIDHLQITQP